MKHGGRRTGAGRPKGSGKYRDATQVVRMPVGMIDEVLSYIQTKGHRLPLYGSHVSAGFPSPADDHIEAQLNLNTHLIKNPASTFFVRASGDSMKNAGIYTGDILIVDRSIEPVDDKVVVVAIDGELTVKRLKIKNNNIYFMPENPDFKPIVVKELQDVHIWGVVTNVIHAL